MPGSKLVEVRMVRENLDDIPLFAAPLPFFIRGYQTGDAATWVEVHRQAERHHSISEALFRREFGEDEALLFARQYFLCDGLGRAVGTATAWVAQPGYGPSYGRIHWVAIVPPLQGRGLSKPLVAQLLRRFVELGNTRAYLSTETVRLPAILLYQKFGFVPEIRDERDLEAWQALRGQSEAIKLPSAKG